MLRAILNKSWQQHPTRHQLYGHLPPITKTIQARRTRHAGHCWRSKDELVCSELLWTPHMASQKQDDQLEHTYSSYVMIRDVTLKTCQRRWMIGRHGERGSGISVLVARNDDDDDFLLKTKLIAVSLRTYWSRFMHITLNHSPIYIHINIKDIRNLYGDTYRQQYKGKRSNSPLYICV